MSLRAGGGLAAPERSGHGLGLGRDGFDLEGGLRGDGAEAAGGEGRGTAEEREGCALAK